MDWGDWVLTAILISCLINHYFFTVLNIAQPIIDFTRLITALISVIFIACKVVSGYKSKELITIFFKNHPLQLFILIIACGATAAFFLPLILNISKFIGETDKLTTALLASTGGVIAVFTLIKTHQKNQNDEMSLQLDREKYEQQKEDRLRDIEMQNSQMKEQKRQFNKKTKQEAYSSHQERIRQIYAERHSRYTTAVEQLANEKAAVRLGGIYTLVGLVDEWLADKTLKPEAAQKEGQIIINNLCSYIREPFTEADYLIEKTDIATYFEDNYLTLQHYDEFDSIDDDPLNSIRSMYSDLKIPVPIKEESEIRKSIIQEITNRLKKHTGKINDKNTFDNKWSAFNYDFSNAHFFYAFDIRNTIWRGTLDLSGAYFTNDVYLTDCTVATGATLEGTKFGGINIECETEFSKISPIWNVILFNIKFTKNSNFTNVNFTNESLFAKLEFTTPSCFTKAVFNCPADFMDTTFKPGTCFDDAIFKDEASFINKKIQCGISFENAKLNSNFDHNFSAIDKIGVAKLAGDNQEITERKIPVGARLFDPNSWDEEEQKYTRVSDPAEPLDESDEAQENKTE